MAYEIVWLPAAIEDLAGIERYIAAQSEVYAGNVVRKIIAAADDLAELPFIGSVVREVEDLDLRQRIVYQHRLVYRVHGQQVRIAAVIHGARLLPNALGGRPL